MTKIDDIDLLRYFPEDRDPAKMPRMNDVWMKPGSQKLTAIEVVGALFDNKNLPALVVYRQYGNRYGVTGNVWKKEIKGMKCTQTSEQTLPPDLYEQWQRAVLKVIIG